MDSNAKCVLNDIYLNAKTGSQGIHDLLPKVKNAEFRSDLQTQDQSYRAIQNEAANRLMQMGETPDEIGPMKKATMWMSTSMSVMNNQDTSHLAEMMITGSTMGITNMTKVLNTYQNPDPQIKGLADQLIEQEHNNIQRLKTYLH